MVLLQILLLALSLTQGSPAPFDAGEKPANVLLVSIDDLNDWVGVLNGHPQAKTPNIDRLARLGTLFSNAHCQSPVCQPSRASLMTSRLPSTTGLYFLNPGIVGAPKLEGALTIPERFAKEGYRVMGADKLFHGIENRKYFSKAVKELAGEHHGRWSAPHERDFLERRLAWYEQHVKN